MNRAKFNKEIKNIKILFQYFIHYGFQHGFWTLADALLGRLKIEKLHEYADIKRYELCKNYLRKNFGEVVEKYKKTELCELSDKIAEDCNIWIFWWQGEDKFPYPVDLCVQSIRNHADKHPVVLITEKNYMKYVSISDYTMEKFKKGIISYASFSDILRFELLYKYGGIWLDSTYYFTNMLQPDIYKRNFFSVSNSKNGRKWVVTKDIWSISFIAMTPKHPLAKYMCESFRTYWLKENVNIAYLLTDCFMSIGYEDVPLFKKILDSVPDNNTGIFDFLQPVRNEVCTQQQFELLMGNTYIHKLTYKEKYIPEIKGKKTYFGWLINQ